MTPDQITGELYLPAGRQMEARWWMIYSERISESGLVYHGYEVESTVAKKVTHKYI